MFDIFDPLFLIKTAGLIGVFAIIFTESGLFFGFFFPGDSLLFTAGLLASQGPFSFPELFLGSALSASLGGIFGYAFGKQIGPSLFARQDSFFFRKKYLIQAQDYYQKHGIQTILLARFLPVVRTFAPILAGIGAMPYKTFLIFNIVGAFVWTLLLCGLGFYLGNVIPDPESYILPVVLIIVVLSFLPAMLKFLRARRASR
jgi:membrane-associated protein